MRRIRISERFLSGTTIQNNELLRTILDMALQRIRNNHREFSDAVLTRAHIRVIGTTTILPA
jgi:hypothetical protein